ncbi:LuxR C-terminal-related transcriptional regulator [Nostoc sp. CHAB 5836]|nr:LuxR C-terminal-related transcriptional regulator [Nostoc sp. CHAB 5836]MCC5615052.1 LuxR C-terminal-related transcriptional regulator [Nostoc sp. CHAB 5836]
MQAEPLTNRELQVLELIVQGYSNNRLPRNSISAWEV